MMIIIEVIIIRPQTGTMVVSFDLKTESNFSPGLRRGQLQGAVWVHRAGPGDQGQPLVGKQELFSRSRVYSESEFQICLQNLSSFGSSSAYLCFAPRCDENVVFILRNCKKKTSNYVYCINPVSMLYPQNIRFQQVYYPQFLQWSISVLYIYIWESEGLTWDCFNI